MDSTRWERIQSLFHDVADLPEPEQHAFLKDACRDDEGLAAEVLALVEEDARGSSLLDGDLAQVAHQVLDEALPASLPFKEFGPYRISEVLGEGGMGVVYLAERADLGSLVAIKILRDAWLSPARRERFASEQRTLAQLNHPSIARLYDADTLARRHAVVRHGVRRGRAAHRVLPDARVLHRGPAAAVPRRVRGGAARAPARGHPPRPQAVEHPGQRRRHREAARLRDRQAAREPRAPRSTDQTRTGLRLMTPAYAAPEQIRGDRRRHPHRRLLARRHPLRAAGGTASLRPVASRTPEKPTTVIVGRSRRSPPRPQRQTTAAKRGPRPLPPARPLWADLDVLCLTAMHKDPARRYQSVEALIRDIDHYLEGEPLEARPDTVRYRLGKFVRRNRRAGVRGGPVLAIVVGLVVFYTVRLAKARNAAVAEAARTQRIQRFMINLFQGGDEAAGPADSLRVVTLLDRGVQEAQTLDGDPGSRPSSTRPSAASTRSSANSTRPIRSCDGHSINASRYSARTAPK